jgi:hypothetical protein
MSMPLPTIGNSRDTRTQSLNVVLDVCYLAQLVKRGHGMQRSFRAHPTKRYPDTGSRIISRRWEPP